MHFPDFVWPSRPSRDSVTGPLPETHGCIEPSQTHAFRSPRAPLKGQAIFWGLALPSETLYRSDDSRSLCCPGAGISGPADQKVPSLHLATQFLDLPKTKNQKRLCLYDPLAIFRSKTMNISAHIAARRKGQ